MDTRIRNSVWALPPTGLGGSVLSSDIGTGAGGATLPDANAGTAFALSGGTAIVGGSSGFGATPSIEALLSNGVTIGTITTDAEPKGAGSIDASAISASLKLTLTPAADGPATAALSGPTEGPPVVAAEASGSLGPVGATLLATTSGLAAPAVSVRLASDTGTSATDHVTSNASLTGSGDGNATVTFTEGATVLGTTTAAADGSWSFTPSRLADGAHTIVASETDAAGNTSTATLTFTLDATAPAVTAGLASDTGASATDQITANAALAGSGDGNATVTFTEGATVLGTTTAAADGSWSFTPSGLADGTHTIVASETDAAGNTATATVSFTLDTTAPTVTETLASDTGKSAADHITSNAALSGSGDANATVTFTEGATVLGTTTAAADGSWSFTPSGLADGTHTIVASETDAAGNTATATVSFTLDTTAPTITEALASDTGTSATDHVTSNATLTGTGDGNATVTFTEGASVLGTATAVADGGWNFTPTGLSDGTHTIVASETDAAGNIGTATLSFTLDRTAPAVTESLTSDTGTSATDHVTSNAALTGSGDGNTTVTFTEGATVLGTTTAAANGSWNFTPTGLADGTHTIVASETDAAGNIGTATLSLTLDTTAPWVEATQVSQTGSGSSSQLNFGGYAENGSTISTIVDKLLVSSTGAVSSTIGTFSANATADSITGAWSFTTAQGSSNTYSGNSSYEVDVTSKDAAGNQVTTTSFFSAANSADSFTATSGTDYFVYRNINESTLTGLKIDSIHNFTSGQDLLDLSGIGGLNSNNQNCTVSILTLSPTLIDAHTILLIEIGGNTDLYANATDSQQNLLGITQVLDVHLAGVSLSTSDLILHH